MSETDGEAHHSTAPTDELRLALSLNGGTSLAVWISGAVEELDALRTVSWQARGDRTASANVYAVLCQMLELHVTIDIAAGTSAGGLNGAVLGSAVAGGTRLHDLRTLWLKLADFSALLRDTGDPEPLSLLDGDGYIMPRLTKQLERQLGRTGEPPSPPPPSHLLADGTPTRFRLILTGTDMTGIDITPMRD